jgi:S-DNA-T family DNA segregation ATPase FtsK/SpoIIIE
MSGNKSQAVHLRNPWATGFTGSTIELIMFLRKHPFLSFVGFLERVAVFLIVHYIFTITLVATIYGWFTNKLTEMVVVSVALATAYVGYRLWRESRNYTDPGLWQLVRGLWRVRTVKKRWKGATVSGGFRQPPRIKSINSSPNGVTVQVDCGSAGHSVHKLVEGSDEIAAVVGCNESKVETITPGLADMHLVWGDPTSRVLTLHDIDQTPDNSRVSFGLDPDGYPVSLSLTTSILIVGESESGKSNALWAVIGGLVRKKYPFRLRVIDNIGGVELDRLNKDRCPLTISYAEAGVDANVASVLRYAEMTMNRRAAAMKASGARKHVITDEEPLEVLVIDEVLDVTDRGPDSSLFNLIRNGRKFGCIVIALSQLGQIDSIGRIRDLFPQRLCLATKSREMTDAVLGPGAERDGARCSRISNTTPGVGYYYMDGKREFIRFRTPMVTDADADELALGKFPTEMSSTVRSKSPLSNRGKLARRKTAVYRLYDSSGELLYIGKTVHPNQRFREHSEEQMWWSEVDMSKTTIDWYPSGAWASRVEIASIRSERPKYNIVGAPLVMSSVSKE